MPPSATKGTETPVVAKTRPLQGSSSSSADTSQIIRDIKGLNLALTKALETKPLSDPDVEFQRQNLRRRYQTLLFSHHPHPSSSSLTSLEPSPVPHPSLLLHVEGLWIQTTHAIIALHRAKITALSNPPPPPSSSSNNSKPGHRPPPPPTVPSSARHHLPAGARPVELRKQLTKFRAFLSAEIAFYSTLAGRFVRSLGVEEARPFLSSLGIVVAEGNEVDALIKEGGDAEGSGAGTSGVTSGALLGRKVVTKLLVCLGDLERYREMYSERERERKGRLENGKSVVPEEKRFERAREVYSRARELMPENGNPFNQLAVISTYIHDPFSATYFYLRALSIQDPFVTARGNLQSTLRRPLDAWKTAGRGADVVVGGGLVDEGRLKKEVVLLQAMFALKSGRFSHQSSVVLSLFRTLLLSRSLAVDTILRTIVLPISSHWDGLFSRPVPRADKDHARSKINVEAPVLEHVLDLFSTLLEVAASEIKETLSTEQKSKLEKGSIVEEKVEIGKEEDATNATKSANLDKSSQHLTAVLRRALPTLRIVSKWLIVHAGYLARTSQSPPPYPTSSSSSSSSQTTNVSSSAIPPKIHHLWKSYSTLLNTLFIAFPFSELQSLVDPLEEDLEMKGFGPLGKRMGENWTGARLVLVKGIAQREEGGGGLHPNEEMLMRIWDLEKDGKAMASGEEGDRAAGVKLKGGRFLSRKTPEEQRAPGNEVKEPKEKKKAVDEDVRTATPEPLVEIIEPFEEPSRSPPPSSPPPTSLPAPILPTKVAPEPTPSPEPTPLVDATIVEQPPATESYEPVGEQEKEEDEATEEEAALEDADSGSHASNLEHDLELASVSTETEDDPVNRAMRAALDDGESALGDEDEFAANEGRGDFQEDEEDERIVWPAPVGRRDTVTAGSTSPFASGLLPPKPTTPIAAPRSPPTSSGLTAHDLLQQMSSSSASSPASSNLQRDGSRSSNLLFGSNTNTNISSIWGSPVVGGGGSGGGPPAPSFVESPRAPSGNWGAFASNEAGRMQDGPGGGGFVGGPAPPQNNQFNSSPSINQHQNYPSPELRFSNAPPLSNGFPSNGYPSSPSHRTQYQQQPSLPSSQYQPAYSVYNNYQPNLYQGLPQSNGNNNYPPPPSTYRPQGLAPSGGFPSYSTPLPPHSTSPLHGFQGVQQPRHSPSSSFGQQQPWIQQQQQQFATPPSAPPGLGQQPQQQQQFPPGLQQSYSNQSGGGGARVNPWG